MLAPSGAPLLPPARQNKIKFYFGASSTIVRTVKNVIKNCKNNSDVSLDGSASCKKI